MSRVRRPIRLVETPGSDSARDDNGLMSSPVPDVPPRLARLFEELVAACRETPAVRAAWLGGSLARGTADDWSDIDLHLAVDDPGAFDTPVWVAAVTPTVLVDEIVGVPGAHVVLTPDLLHVDVVVHHTDEPQDETKPARAVHDPGGRVRDTTGADQRAGGPWYPAADVRVFLYLMGVTVTGVRRGEVAGIAHGTAAMRDTMLVPLMLAENGVRKADGAKRLRPYLTDEQHAALERLPAVGLDDALLDAHRAVAGEYLRRARRLAATCGEDYPEELERATLRLWADELGIAPS
jgi:predicted nucleotidyltransferase